ncbi:MAG: c-type cytochrome, partial [Verrucomicrobiales bacterium]|nr:c-type cytochrome [Verrucomicrobiales bacterium]
DANGDDQYDDLQFLKQFEGDSGEHGPHAIVLGPDKKLYVMNGNHVKVPEGLAPNSPHRNYEEDLLLPRRWDPSGHATGILPPGGYLLRTDAEGQHWEMLHGGFRNTYDFAFNADGEMFGFDADMEYDVGLPWYRPTRIYHLVSGGEYGWRSGSGKFPDYYPDNLPPVLDIGLGSPTGVKFGTGSQFPPKYQKALFAMDWTHGRILAVHLRPKGSSYTGTFETFIQGKPLPVTDLEFGRDGAMYFIIGGRGNQSGLYRVSSVGPRVNEPNKEEEKAAAEARALRHKLESYHDKKDSAAIEFAWPHLDSEDRWIRYAARIAIESQDLALWKDRALAERRINAGLAALLALARNGGPELQDVLLESLVDANHQLSEGQTLEYLRVLSLAFIRMGRPSEEKAQALAERLDRMYPALSESLNRELCQLLIYLQSPRATKKTLALVVKASTQEDKLGYLFHLPTLNSGWTMEDRKTYLQWLNGDWSSAPKQAKTYFDSVGRKYADGPTFSRWLGFTKSDAALTMTGRERAELAPMLASRTAALPPAPRARSFVREWTLKDLEPNLGHVSNGRSFEKGKDAFAAAQCLACHRFNGEGGATGQDLTTAASRFDRRTLLESILEPSKVISDQYHHTILVRKDGTEVTGRIVEEDVRQIVLLTNPFTEDRAEVWKADVQTRVVSKVSPMPEGLVNVLTQEDILDLLAFVESGGKADASAFANSGK